MVVHQADYYQDITLLILSKIEECMEYHCFGVDYSSGTAYVSLTFFQYQLEDTPDNYFLMTELWH